MNHVFKTPVLICFVASAFVLTACSPTTAPGQNQAPRPQANEVFKPLVTIRNQSPEKILMGLRGPETRFISIPAGESRSVNIQSGSYKFAATSPQAPTVSGQKYFGTSRTYFWDFKLK